MSSPVVNKDTLYFYRGKEGKYFMGFCWLNTSNRSEGWSKYFNSFKTIGFKFKQNKPYNGNPIGQRCILQWQNQ